MYAMLATEYTTSVLGYATYTSHLVSTAHATHYKDHGTPYASDDPEKRYHIVGRDQAIAMTHAIRRKMDHIVFFTDFGLSSGMRGPRSWRNVRGLTFSRSSWRACPAGDSVERVRALKYAAHDCVHQGLFLREGT